MPKRRTGNPAHQLHLKSAKDWMKFQTTAHEVLTKRDECGNKLFRGDDYFVFHGLCKLADYDGRINSSRSLIAEHLAMDESNLRKSIRKLAEWNLLYVDEAEGFALKLTTETQQPPKGDRSQAPRRTRLTKVPRLKVVV